MANCESSVSSSSGEQFRLVDLNLPRLNDEEIKIQVKRTHAKHYALVLRQPLLVSISHILEPATNFVDSILLDHKVSENGTELETNNLLELNSTFSELDALVGGRCFSTRTLLDREVVDRVIKSGASILQEFSTISELKILAGHDYFMIPTLMMEKTANNVMQMSDEINVHKASKDLLQFLSNLSWDAKAVNTMGCFVFKFLEFLGFLLHGTNQPIIDLASSMAALKENRISLVGSSLEKFQVPLDQLNNLIKLTLEVIEYISKFTLLADTEYNKEDLLSMCAYWAILSVVVCYVQITLLMHNGEVALETSHLISNLNHILNDLKHHYTICKPQIEEMEAHLKHIALFEDAFSNKKQISETPTEMSELMKSFMYSKDGCHSFIDGSTKSMVDLEVLKEKAVIFLISDLNINTLSISHFLDIYEKIKEENYYKIVWVPFVLKWTKDLRQKFEKLKSMMPWYIVCYDSPITGVWYIKGRPSFFIGKKPNTKGRPSFFNDEKSYVIIDLRYGNQYQDLRPNCFDYSLEFVEAEQFPFKRLSIGGPYWCLQSAPPTLLHLYPERHDEDVNQVKPPSGFQGLLAMCTRRSLNPKHAKLNLADVTSKASTISLTSRNAK